CAPKRTVRSWARPRRPRAGGRSPWYRARSSAPAPSWSTGCTRSITSSSGAAWPSSPGRPGSDSPPPPTRRGPSSSRAAPISAPTRYSPWRSYGTGSRLRRDQHLEVDELLHQRRVERRALAGELVERVGETPAAQPWDDAQRVGRHVEPVVVELGVAHAHLARPPADLHQIGGAATDAVGRPAHVEALVELAHQVSGGGGARAAHGEDVAPRQAGGRLRALLEERAFHAGPLAPLHEIGGLAGDAGH